MAKTWSHKSKHSRENINKVIEKIRKALCNIVDGTDVQMEICGSYRRGKELCGDIDVLFKISTDEQWNKILIAIHSISNEILTHGLKKSNVLIDGIQVDIAFSYPDSWGTAVLHYTGPVEENFRLRKIAKAKGLRLNEYGITEVKSGKVNKFLSENEIYEFLKIDYVRPEKR